MDLAHALAAGLGAGGAALVGGYLLQRTRRTETGAVVAARSDGDLAEMLVTDGVLTEATPQARRLLDCRRDERLGWRDIRAALEPSFGPLPDAPPRSPVILQAHDDPQTLLRLTPEDAELRMTITTPPTGSGDLLRYRTDQRELAQLRRVVTRAPMPIWQTDADRRVVWSNAGFADLCAQAGLPDHSVPPFAILPDIGEEYHVTRSSIGSRAENSQAWFEVQSYRLPDGWLHYAQSIDAVIHAEIAQRNFLQTLTRIFAHLPIALAVFDRDRRLVLFNPALVDLTGLAADFLSARPNLLSFFDMLREKRMMPEPKDYGGWRDTLRDVIAAASTDHYIETWNLASGLTYRVTGRPHPDGGVAFLFEDITAEISLTRRFRQEIEVTQAVLDSLDDAVAVFSQLGVLSFCNAAYRDMWGGDPDGSLADTDIADASRLWQAGCDPSPIWPDLRDFVLTLRDRAGWDAELTRQDGQTLTLRAEPLVGGSTMVRFSGPVGRPGASLAESRQARA